MDQTESRYASRADLLREAERIVTQERNKSYGEPDEDFRRIAAIASAMGFRIVSDDTTAIRSLQGDDVAKFMIALKLSRLMWMPDHRDSWLDIAGYAACGFETAALAAGRQAENLPAEEIEEESQTNSQISWDMVRELANRAINGSPEALEADGWFLHIRHLNALCNSCTVLSHIFGPGCNYRIRRRRQDG